MGVRNNTRWHGLSNAPLDYDVRIILGEENCSLGGTHLCQSTYTCLRKIKLLIRCQLKEQLLASTWTPSTLCPPPLYVETLFVVFVSHILARKSVSSITAVLTLLQVTVPRACSNRQCLIALDRSCCYHRSPNTYMPQEGYTILTYSWGDVNSL